MRARRWAYHRGPSSGHPTGEDLRLTGSITALATPFTTDGELDLDGWRRLIAAQLEGGTQALVVAGSTGEAAALFDAEFDVLLRTAVEQVGGRVPVLAGTGMSNTVKTMEQTRRAAVLGADAALVVTPPYVRPTQDGLVAHFRAVANDGALPLVLYNVPGRTGCDLLPETVAALAGHPRIIAVKEARNEPDRMAALLTLAGDGFAVLSGDDPTACRALLAGADGVVSVASNIIPVAFRMLCDLGRSRDSDAGELDARLRPVFDFLGVESNPTPVKAILELQGIGHGLRLPLLPLSAANMAGLEQVAGDITAIEQSVRATIAT